MKEVYCVEHVEVEFGERPEGYKIFTNEQTCVSQTQEDSIRGAGKGQYLGPVRPLQYYKVPFDSLDEEIKEDLSMSEVVLTHKNWTPQYKSNPVPIY